MRKPLRLAGLVLLAAIMAMTAVPAAGAGPLARAHPQAPAAQASGSFWYGWYLINENTGLCLDDPGQSLYWGELLWQYTCNGTTAQIWGQRSDSNGQSFANIHSGLCVSDLSLGSGSLVAQLNCDSEPGVEWNLIPVPGGQDLYFWLENRTNRGMCLGIPAGEYDSENLVQVINCDQSALVTWHLQYVPGLSPAALRAAGPGRHQPA